MRYNKKMLLVVIVTALCCLPLKAEMTIQELFFDSSKPFHLKILNVIPEDGIVQIGDDNAKNTIIEFMDYFCGYCKKVHPELLQIANERDDVRLILASKLLDTQIAKELIANAISLDRSLSSHTWSTLAQISLDRQASWHDDCLMQLQKQHGVTPQWLILKAQALHEVGKTVTARQLIISHVNKQTLQQSADTVQWQLVQARFLTMIGDHLAAHLAWQHLINTYPNNLTVTKSILEQPTENQQMALRQKAIDQLHRLTGDLAVRWRYEQALLHLKKSTDNQSLAATTLLMHDALNIAPSAIECRMILIKCMQKIRSAQGIQEQAQAILQVDPYNTTAKSLLRQDDKSL